MHALTKHGEWTTIMIEDYRGTYCCVSAMRVKNDWVVEYCGKPGNSSLAIGIGNLVFGKAMDECQDSSRPASA